MSWGNFLRSALPVAAGVLGSPVAGALVGGGLGMLNQRAQARGMERAGQAGQQGFNYLQNSAIGQQYLPAGGQAMQAQSDLLGLGGDPAAAQAAYQNYLNSTGYQGQMQAGQQAITGSAAARGMLGSGATAKALTGFGQQLGAQSFGNYLGQLGGMANMGLHAGNMMGQAAGQAGQFAYGAGMGAAGARGAGWDQMIGGIGQARKHWQAGRKPGAQPGANMAPVSGQLAPLPQMNALPQINRHFGVNPNPTRYNPLAPLPQPLPINVRR